MGMFSLVVQHTIEVVCFMKGHVLQGVLHGPEPLVMVTGLRSV